MTSLYHYQKSFSPVVQKQSFSEFLYSTNTTDSYSYDGSFSKVGYWAFHVSKWLSKENVLSLSFDELKNDSNLVINKIANHVGLEPNKKVIDVGMEKAGDGSKVLDKSAKRSSVSFRKGVSGDWVNEFSKSDLEYFHQEVDSVSAEINKKLYRI
jgi:hypothetical protein